MGNLLDIKVSDIADSLEDELFIIDSKYRLRFANSAAQQKYAKSDQELLGKRCYEVFHARGTPCAAPIWSCPLNKILRRGKPEVIVYPRSAPAGDKTSTGYIKITFTPWSSSKGNIYAICELRRDVTAERELETQILKRHHQLLALSHISSAVSGVQDLDTVLEVALENVLEIIGDAVGGILLIDNKSKTLYYRVQHGLSAKYTENRGLALGEGITGRAAQNGELLFVEDISKDPRAARPDLVSAKGIKGFVSVPLKVKDKVVGVMNIFSRQPGRFGADDAFLLNSIGDYLGTSIEQTRLHERLARVGERYKALLQQSLITQEQERRRISRELHDETAQALTSFTLSLQAVIGTAETKGYNAPEFMEKLTKTHSYAVRAGNDIVKLMKELRPTLLDEMGLPAAINRYAKDNLQSQGINLSTEFIDTDQRFQPEIEITLFRIAQASIGNILEHSEAKNASIKLDCSGGECVLSIEDDGKGFNVDDIKGIGPGGRGAGLFTMRERTNLLGGRGYVESAPGKGTKVIARVPLQRDVTDEED